MLTKRDRLKATQLCREMLSLLLDYTNPDGSLGDERQEVLTHNLLILLTAWKNPALAPVVQRATDWFAMMEDGEGDNFDPFKLYAFAYAQPAEHKGYISDKTRVLREKHKKAQGCVVLQLGSTFTGDVQEVFPTLMAADLLIEEGSVESLESAHSSIVWALNEIKSETVYRNVSSILGFAALVCVKFGQVAKTDEFDAAVNEFVNRIVATQNDGLWEGSKYQSAWVFFDIATMASLDDSQTCLHGMIRGFLARALDPGFFRDEQTRGQDAVLVFTALLRGFAVLLSPKSKNMVVHGVLDSALMASSEFRRRASALRVHEQKMEAMLEDLHARRLMPVNPLVFRERKFDFDPGQVFVLMPYGYRTWFRLDPMTERPRSESFDFDRPFNRLIAPTLEHLGFSCIRADSIFDPKPLMEKIWRQINESALILADVTSMNANVLYELGIAHTLGKPIIILTQAAEYVPTDLKSIEYVQYDADLGDEDKLRAKLTRAVQHTLNPR